MVDRKNADRLTEVFANECTVGVGESGIKPAMFKFAVEAEEITEYGKKMLQVMANVQKAVHIPLYLHTNANNGNGEKAVKLLMEYGADITKLTVGHLSGATDAEYVLKIAEMGCMIGLDRLCDNERNLKHNANIIRLLTEAGYGDRIVLSHDAIFYSDFSDYGNEWAAQSTDNVKFTVIHRKFIPVLKDKGFDDGDIKKLVEDNPRKMLCI